MLNKLGGFIKENYTRAFFGFSFLVVFAVLYFYKLGSIIPLNNYYETADSLLVNSYETLFQFISFFPIKLLEFIAIRIDESHYSLRAVSALVIFIVFIMFYRLVLKWQTYRIAVLSTLLFMSSAFSLAVGRTGSQQVMYFLIIPMILLFGSWLRAKKYVKRIIYILPALAILMYVPGFIWLALAITIVFYKRLSAAWSYSDYKNRIIGSILSVLILLPLVYSALRYPANNKTVFGIDRLFDGTALEALINIPKQLFWSGIDASQIWLVGTPIIDVVILVFFILGIFAYTKSEHTLRARLLLGLLAACVIIISLSTYATVALLVPLIYLYAAKGMAFMLQNWFTVFPRNPIARGLAVGLILIPVGLSVGYNLNKYFVAWPNAPRTSEVLQID